MNEITGHDLTRVERRADAVMRAEPSPRVRRPTHAVTGFAHDIRAMVLAGAHCTVPNGVRQV